MLSRADLVKAMLIGLPTAPLFGSPLIAHADVFVQADDKSFDFQLPDTWKLDNVGPRAEHPDHIFHVKAQRADGKAAVDLTVDFVEAKTLNEYGSLESIGRQLLATQGPSAELLLASKVPAPGLFAAPTYEYRFDLGSSTGAQSIVKVGLKQKRLYRLAASLSSVTDASLSAEVESIVESYKLFPLNLGCLVQSNRGEAPLPAVCY